MRAATYARISSDPSGQRAGVDRQRADCRALCERRGWEVADEYVDNDASAYSGKPRPRYQALLRDVEAGRVDAIVAWHNDRLHRSPLELEAFISLVERTGVRVAVVEGGDYDLTTPDGRLAARIVGAVARKESEDKSRRLRRKHLELAETGRVSAWQGWGVRSDEERALVRRAAERVLAGASLRSVVADWNDRGVPPPSERATRGWTTIALRRVLLAPRIAGLREHGRDRTGRTLGQLYPATWEGAVSRETWEQLRLVLVDPARARNGGVNARRYLLAGMIFCQRCGARCHARPRADKRRCYVCVSGPNFGGCGKVRRLAEPVEAKVTREALGLLTSPAFRDRLAAHVGGAPEEDREARVALAAGEGRLTRLEEAHFVTGELNRATYDRLRAQLERDLDELRERVNRNRTGGLLLAPDPEAVWEAADLKGRRELLEALGTRVTLLPTVKGRNTFDPTRVAVMFDLAVLLEAGQAAWAEMTDEQREAARRAYEEATAEDRETEARTL